MESTGDKPKLTVSASGLMSTNFMGLLGIKNLKIGTESIVKWGETRVRVALVLDNTGSMASAGKMGALNHTFESAEPGNSKN